MADLRLPDPPVNVDIDFGALALERDRLMRQRDFVSQPAFLEFEQMFQDLLARQNREALNPKMEEGMRQFHIGAVYGIAPAVTYRQRVIEAYEEMVRREADEEQERKEEVVGHRAQDQWYEQDRPAE